MQLGQWYAAEKVNHEDEGQWPQQQAAFFAATQKPKPRAKGEKRRRPTTDTKRVVKARRAPFSTFRALDNALFHARGVGMAAFTESALGMEGPLADRPLLTCFYDECSINLSMVRWTLCKGKIRAVGIRGIFYASGMTSCLR